MSLISNAELATHFSVQSDVVETLQTLIRFKSVTPAQAGAIDWLESNLSQLGFDCVVFSFNHVTNLIAKITWRYSGAAQGFLRPHLSARFRVQVPQPFTALGQAADGAHS